jgi:hypothetical protein
LRHRCETLPAMLYTSKCYWPGVTACEVEQAAERALAATAHTPSRSRPTYLGSLLFPDDDLVLCLFEASSSAAVKRASDQAGIPCERVMDTIWLAPEPHTRDQFVFKPAPVTRDPTAETDERRAN